MTQIRKKVITGLKINEKIVISRKFTEEDVIKFAEVTRDYNPVHFDDRFSNIKKYSGRICHGLLISSMITEIGGQIGWLASEMNFKFIAPVYFGDEITCELTFTKINEKGWCEGVAIYRNQNDAIVLKAIGRGILPKDKEIEILKAMIAEGDPTNKIKKY